MGAQDLSQLLREQRDAIVARFVSQVEQKDLSPKGVTRPLLVDHIPVFLDEIVAELVERAGVRSGQDAVDTSPTARKHGEQRWLLGFDLDALIREYGVLRHVIIEHVKESGLRASVDELDVLAKCLSVGVAEAASAYVRHRDGEIRAHEGNLEFLATAGQLLSESLDYRLALRRLAAHVVPRLADWIAIHIQGDDVEGMTLAHVDLAKGELLRELYRRYPSAVDASGGYGRGEPVVLPMIDPALLASFAKSEEELRLLRALAPCSWVVIPLRVQGTTFGVMTLGYSDSGRHYEESIRTVATELGRSVAVAIDNGRLYELSQRERSRVEAATRAKDEFVAVVSHELRTPLNAILGWLRLMRSGTLTEDKRAHAVDVVERNADSLNKLVADLLDISRFITGKVRINPSQIDVSDIVEMAIEGVRPGAEAKRIFIHVDVDAQNSVVRADGDRLQQVVWNLLSNAVKFTPKDGQVWVRLRRVESDIELVVRDSGNGIDPAFLPHVFEGFSQQDASSSRTYGGLGIGLSIAKHITELHGGTIEAQSEGAGKGATFSVRFPVSPLLSSSFGVSKVPATTPPTPIEGLPAGLSGLRVLVVDDESDARELVSYVLESCGVAVRQAANVAEALGILEEYSPHVVVSDIGMPEEDGYALIRAIRALPSAEQKRLPAIALTAFSRSEDRTRALVEGFNMHIAKPVEPAKLVQAVIDLAGYVRPMTLP